MWSHVISGEFSRAFHSALTHPVKVSILSMSSTLSVVGIATSIFTKMPVLAAGSCLLGATSALGWASVHAGSYEAEFRNNTKINEDSDRRIKELLKKQEEELLHIQHLTAKISSLTEANSNLHLLVESSNAKVKELEVIEKNMRLVINKLTEQTIQQAKDAKSLLTSATPLEEEILRSAHLSELAAKRMIELTASLQQKNQTILDLEQQVSDLTGTLASLQKAENTT